MEYKDYKVILPPEEIPKEWYNILPDLPEPLPPPIDGSTGEPINPAVLERIFAKECIRQEVSTDRFIKIPEEVLKSYLMLGRPTPLHRARRFEEYLGTPAEIYFKREDVSPVGSHKPNTAIAQAYYLSKEGVKKATTETGAGQWGSALCLAGALFSLEVVVFMTRSSYIQKPYRRTVMELFGGKVYPSPSEVTKAGKSFLANDPQHPGSLGIAISEALEVALGSENAKYSLGSVLNHVLLHQSIVGLEVKKQMEILEKKPDVVIGCIGGGSNFAGIAYPLIYEKKIKRNDTRFIAVEPKAVPSTTRGEYTYDYGDSSGMTPMLKMYTVGNKFQIPPIHAAGLRYHGKAPSLSLLIKNGVVSSRAYHQVECLNAGKLFAMCEGIVPAPETAHAIKAVVDEALEAKREGRKEVILFNLSGHGLLDLKAYEDLINNTLVNYEPPKEALAKSLSSIHRVK